MDLQVPDRWEPFIREQVQRGHFASEGEVIDEALRLLRRRKAGQTDERARVEALHIEGLDSGPSTPMTSDDWDAIDREGQLLIEARPTGQPSKVGTKLSGP
jgi:putative addiction module CopG family antidote